MCWRGPSRQVSVVGCQVGPTPVAPRAYCSDTHTRAGTTSASPTASTTWATRTTRRRACWTCRPVRLWNLLRHQPRTDCLPAAGSVPLLYVDGKAAIAQSRAIERYLAKQFNLAGKSDVEAAQVDMWTEHVRDVQDKYQKAKASKDAECEDPVAKWFKDDLPGLLAKLDKVAALGHQDLDDGLRLLRCQGCGPGRRQGACPAPCRHCREGCQPRGPEGVAGHPPGDTLLNGPHYAASFPFHHSTPRRQRSTPRHVID